MPDSQNGKVIGVVVVRVLNGKETFILFLCLVCSWNGMKYIVFYSNTTIFCESY